MADPYNTMKNTYCQICGKKIKINSRMCSPHSNAYNDLRKYPGKWTDEKIIKKLKEKYSVKKYGSKVFNPIDQYNNWR